MRVEDKSRETLKGLVDKCFPKMITIRENRCKEPVPTASVAVVRNTCIMYDAFATAENGVNSADPEGYVALTTAPHRTNVLTTAPSLHARAHHGARASPQVHAPDRALVPLLSHVVHGRHCR
jgi:hypothetical protein